MNPTPPTTTSDIRQRLGDAGLGHYPAGHSVSRSYGGYDFQRTGYVRAGSDFRGTASGCFGAAADKNHLERKLI